MLSLAHMCSKESPGGSSVPWYPSCPHTTVWVITAPCEVTTWLIQLSSALAIPETPETCLNLRISLDCSHLSEEGQALRDAAWILPKCSSSSKFAALCAAAASTMVNGGGGGGSLSCNLSEEAKGLCAHFH